MTGKDRAGVVVEGAVAHSAEVSLPFGLGGVMSVFDDVGSVAVRTFDLVFPTKGAHFVALGIIDQSVNFQAYRVHEKQRTGTKLLTSQIGATCEQASITTRKRN